MPNKRVAQAIESMEDLRVFHSDTITVCLQPEVRADQDKRLDIHIKTVWRTKAFIALRENDIWRPIHQHLYQRVRGEALAIQRRSEGGGPIHVPSMMGDYEQLVITLACANEKPFIPVDVWPSKPKPVEMPSEGHEVFQAAINVLRKEIGLFTPGKLRLNKHYNLLLAHLLLSPDEIHHAHDISVCYPWPFILRLDDEGSAHLERQRDITTSLQLAANKVERALFENEKQALRLARRASRKTVQKRNQHQDEQLSLGKIGYDLHTGPERINYEGILIHPRFTSARERMVTKITTTGALSAAIHAYCIANNRELPKRGRRPG